MILYNSVPESESKIWITWNYVALEVRDKEPKRERASPQIIKTKSSKKIMGTLAESLKSNWLQKGYHNLIGQELRKFSSTRIFHKTKIYKMKDMLQKRKERGIGCVFYWTKRSHKKVTRKKNLLLRDGLQKKHRRRRRDGSQ